MKLKQKFWISMAIILMVPLIFAVVVVDRVLIKGNEDVRGLLYEPYNIETSVRLRETIENYLKTGDTPTLDELKVKLDQVEATRNMEGTTLVILKDDQLAYSVGQLEEDVLMALQDQFAYDMENLQFDRYWVISKMQFTYADESPGMVYYIMDGVYLQNQSDGYWLIQMGVYVLLTLIISVVAILWIASGLEKSIRSAERITRNLKWGNLDEPLDYRHKDEFRPLADEIELLRLSLQNSLRRQKELEGEKKMLVGNISHDLRTPLTAIRGYAQGLKDGIAKTEAEQVEYLDIIENKVQVIEQLVNDLKVLTDIDQKRIQYHKQELHVESFLKDCIDDQIYEVQNAGGALRLATVAQDIFVDADPSKLARVFMNIIQNAVKYQSPKRPLQINIYARQVGETIEIRVEDNGVGVKKKDLPLLFDRFYRADKSRNSDIGGSGIGLSICKDIIDEHGGEIGAKVSQMGGLAVIIRLPQHGRSYDENSIG